MYIKFRDTYHSENPSKVNLAHLPGILPEHNWLLLCNILLHYEGLSLVGFAIIAHIHLLSA